MSAAEHIPSNDTHPDEKVTPIDVADSAARIAEGFIGHTPREQHALLNDQQARGRKLVREGGVYNPEYSRIADEAYRERVERRREHFSTDKVLAALREERRRRTGADS